jgi:hypothetical protein
MQVEQRRNHGNFYKSTELCCLSAKKDGSVPDTHRQ